MTKPANAKKPPAEWRAFSLEVSSGETFNRFCELYRNAIQDQRTRRIKLIGKRCNPQVFNTFLGFEIIGAGKRIICPDMTTARYLRMFAEIGMREIDLPYDVTRTQEWLPDLERAYNALQVIMDFFTDQLLTSSEQQKFQRQVADILRKKLAEISAFGRPIR